MINQERLINNFLDLVKINSESGYEASIQEYLKSYFRQLHVQVTEDNAESYEYLGANNLICTLAPYNAHDNSDKIYFTSHMDTVAPGKNIKPVISEDGYIYSDGTTVLGADDKAGIAAILELIHTLQDYDIAHGQIQFIITVGEESGLEGAKVLDSTLLDAEYGYAVDASVPVGTTVIGAPTQMKLVATIHGKKAHASTPNKGISAINIAAKAISNMHLGQIDHETTANIGRFEGGSATNVVADKVTLQAEARSHSPQKVEAQINHMKKIFEATAMNYGSSATVETYQTYTGFKIDDQSKVTQVAQSSATQLNLEPQTVIAGGGSDGNIINGYGIPTVILGVGYEFIHTTEERMEIKSLTALAQQLLKITQIANQG